MATHKAIGKICCAVLALTLLLTVLFLAAAAHGDVQAAETAMGYEARLFDTEKVHTIDLVMDDWDGFLASCTSEEYVSCAAVIDGEAYKNIAIRAKGNTSLTQVEQYGNNRYSFKIEFDHYDSTKTYHGLDKLSLNNIIQDNTYMKDYLCYQMMNDFGVSAPLCSFVYITVNGEDWGLYLAVEGVEESFLQRNYGADYGELYKPDSQSMGGGRGNGGAFDMDSWTADDASADTDTQGTRGKMDGGFGGGMPTGGGLGTSQDVSLIYSDDAFESYANIFDNAKTEITDADKTRLIAAIKALNAGESIEQTVDVDAVLRYFVVHNFVCNFDSYTGSMIHNYYLYEKDGQMSMIPWDYNLAFGGFVGGQDATSLVNYPIDTPVSGGSVESRPMLAWIFVSEDYTTRYHELFAEFLAELFDSGYVTSLLERTQTLIAPYVEKDPTKFCTYEEFETGAATLKKFCLLRAESVERQLEGTLASTEDGQRQSTSAQVDASEISVSAMGSMNGGAMGGMEKPDGMGGGMTGDMTPPDGMTFPDGATLPDGMTLPDGVTLPDGMTPPDGTQSGEMPQMPDGTQSGEMPEIPDGMQSGEMPQMPDGMQNGETPQMPDDNADGNAAPEFPQGGQNGMTPPDGTQSGEMPDDNADGNAAPELPQGGMQGGQNGMTPPDGTQSGEMPQMPDGTQSGEMPQMPDGTQSGEMPEMPDGARDTAREPQAKQSGAQTWILLGLCVITLLLAIFVVRHYRKRG